MKSRSSVIKELKLTRAELAHLFLLLQYNEAEGTCWGNDEHWWKQHHNIKAKVLDLAKVGADE